MARYDRSKQPTSSLLGMMILFWYALNMSKASHRVPEPLRRTSSGPSGIIVHSAKMNGCTYFMYR